MFDLVGQLDRGDPVRVFRLTGHFRQLAATGGTLPVVGRERVAHLHDRERRLRARAVTGVRRPLRTRRGHARRRSVVLKYLCPPLLQVLERGQLELLRIRQAAQPGEFRGQFQRLRDEALIFAIEEETDLTKRFQILFFRQFHHALRI